MKTSCPPSTSKPFDEKHLFSLHSEKSTHLAHARSVEIDATSIFTASEIQEILFTKEFRKFVIGDYRFSTLLFLVVDSKNNKGGKILVVLVLTSTIYIRATNKNKTKHNGLFNLLFYTILEKN